MSGKIDGLNKMRNYFPFFLFLSILCMGFSAHLQAKVYTGTIDVKSTPDFYHFGFGYKKISVPELNFSNMPSINVYIRNPIVANPCNNHWILLSDPRSLMLADGVVYIAYTVANGRPIFDGTYRITVLTSITNAYDKNFFKLGPVSAMETLGTFIVPRGMTLKAVKMQVINPSNSGATAIMLQKSSGNNTPFANVLTTALTVPPGMYYVADAKSFIGTNHQWKENDLVKVYFTAAASDTRNISVTLVVDYND
ncbi:hypothetical protein ACFL35_08945 [Candidatus Riflebacteria bacterium]